MQTAINTAKTQITFGDRCLCDRGGKFVYINYGQPPSLSFISLFKLANCG
jgi:hypothetical protein